MCGSYYDKSVCCFVNVEARQLTFAEVISTTSSRLLQVLRKKISWTVHWTLPQVILMSLPRSSFRSDRFSLTINLAGVCGFDQHRLLTSLPAQVAFPLATELCEWQQANED